MFDLEKAIAEWRRSMSGIDPQTLSELESHLRDAIEERTRAGENPDAAFKSAVAALGSVGQLREEFAKTKKMIARPNIFQIVCFGAAGVIATGAISGLWLVPANAIERVMFGSFGAIVVLFFLKLPFLMRPEPRFIPFPPVGDFEPGMQLCFAASVAEASRLGHDFIGTEHMLLGLLQAQEGPVGRLLARHGIRREELRKEIEAIVGKGSAQMETARCTPRLRRAFELASADARRTQQSQVRPEHVFLGLLEGDGVAARVLARFGLNRAVLQSEL